MVFQCPACGAEVVFKSRLAVYGVCSYCNSMLVRHDLDVASLGKQAILPPDMSPLQIGTTGVFGGSRFELVGRVRQSWSNGFWNEWYVLFDDGRAGWLGEAQGQYMMSFSMTDTSGLPSVSEELRPGQRLNLQGQGVFQVDDIKHVTTIGSQGELPFRGIQGRRSVSVDLSASGGVFATAEYSDEGLRFYLGKSLEFDDLAFSNLREMEGW